MESESRSRAVRLLIHYLTLQTRKNGKVVDRDVRVEIEEIVDSIIDATCKEVQERLLEGLKQGVFKSL